MPCPQTFERDWSVSPDCRSPRLPASAERYGEHLEGKLWEIRVAATSGIPRAIYVTISGKRVIIIRVFVKKTQKTPLRELQIARQRAKDVK